MSEVEELRAEIARLKGQQQEDKLTIGFGNKGNVKVGARVSDYE